MPIKKVQKITIKKKFVVTELKYFGRLNESRVFGFRDNKDPLPQREMLPPPLPLISVSIITRQYVENGR